MNLDRPDSPYSNLFLAYSLFVAHWCKGTFKKISKIIECRLEKNVEIQETHSN